MGLIDSHAHLTFPQLRDRIEGVLARCEGAGVDGVVTLGTDLDDGKAAIELAGRHPSRIHAAVGFHPHEVDKVTAADVTAMAELWDHPGVVGVGEIGLDYHYDLAGRKSQRSVFARQLELVASRAHALVIHCREAFEDVIPMLVDHGFEGRRVVFHCFTGTTHEALRIQERGWWISFTGIVTFPKSTVLQRIAKVYPHSALMIETDSPYLSPVPVRSRVPNEPAHLIHIARFLADLRGVSYDELVHQTARNTCEFFGL